MIQTDWAKVVRKFMRSLPVPGKYLDRVLNLTGVDLSSIQMPQVSPDRWNQFNVIIDRFDTQIKKHIFFQGYFEWAETHFVRNSLQAGHTFVDVGANIGWHTLIAASRVSPNGRVFAFEPVSSTFSELQSNIDLNRLTNVELYQIGLSDSSGSVDIFANKENDSGGNSMFGTADYTRLETIQTRRGDEVLMSRGVEQIDLLKVDVEGAEMYVLRGLERYFAEGRIKAMMLEVNGSLLRAAGSSPRELLDFVHGKGFAVADVRNPRQVLRTLPDDDSIMNICCWRQSSAAAH
jgi:FkbM family methyltransferase